VQLRPRRQPRRCSRFSSTRRVLSYAQRLLKLLSQPATTKLALDRMSAKSNMSPALTRSRSRKVQPALKERAEAFLAKASADMSSPLKPKDVPSRKRKRTSLDVGAKQSQALVPDAESSSSKPVRKVSKASKARPGEALERSDESQDLATAPFVEEDAERLMPRTQAGKALKAKAKEDAKEPQEKRLKIFRKQVSSVIPKQISIGISFKSNRLRRRSTRS
jgi:hypothetical protein